MQIFRTNLTPGMTVLLVVLAVLFAFIVVPLLLIGGFVWLVCNAITGSSPLELYLRRKARRRPNVYEGPFARDGFEQDDVREASASNDDTIECEVISARTFDEKGQEIR